MGYDVKKLWKGNRLQIRYPVIYGGDSTRPSGEPFVLGVQGALGRKQKPQCVHISNVHADLLPTDVYSGMYARVTVNFFPYDASGNRGVGCGLGNVCKTRDGEPLGSRANAVRQRTPVRFRSWCGRHWCPSPAINSWTRTFPPSRRVWLRGLRARNGSCRFSARTTRSTRQPQSRTRECITKDEVNYIKLRSLGRAGFMIGYDPIRKLPSVTVQELADLEEQTIEYLL